MFDAFLQSGAPNPLAHGPHAAGVAALLLLCGGLLATPAQDGDSEVRRHFQAARSAQSAGKLDVAEREYSEALSLQPEVAQIQASLGLVYYLQARYEDSARMLGKAVAREPGLRGVSLFLGIDYVKLNQPRLAVPLLRQAVAQEPSSKEAATWLGTALWDAGQSAEAIRQLHTVAQAFPTDPDALFMLGQAYWNQSMHEIEGLISSIASPIYHLVFGDLYTQRQDWLRAVWHFKRAIAQDPHRVGGHLGLGEAYLRQAKWDEAREEFRRELSVAPDSAAARARLA